MATTRYSQHKPMAFDPKLHEWYESIDNGYQSLASIFSLSTMGQVAKAVAMLLTAGMPSQDKAPSS